MSKLDKPPLIFSLSSFSGFNTGIGGHYRSVLEFSKLLSHEFDVSIITFGNISSPVYWGLKNYTHVEASSSLSPRALRRLRNAVVEAAGGKAVKIITTGLNNDYAPMRLASSGLGACYYHVKPGGKAATAPSVFNGIPLAVFHEEDAQVFRRIDPQRSLVVTPGRVSPPVRDPAFLELSASPVFAPNAANVACVMRISDYYAESIAGIHESLRDIHNITFTHYGTIQDEEVHRTIRARDLGCPYALVTDPDVTASAAKAIHPFQVFVGMGRSALEAMSLGIATFIPVRSMDGRWSLRAVTDANWQVFAKANFTARVSVEDLAATGSFLDLSSALEQSATLEQLGLSCRTIFKEHFSAESSRETWMQFLRSSAFKGNARDAVRVALLFRSEMRRLIKITRAKFWTAPAKNGDK